MRLGIAADHGGFDLKRRLELALEGDGHTLCDYGAAVLDPDDDFPEFIVPLARGVADRDVERGIAICGSGVGACVVANKVPGVRAALVTDAITARQGVEDDAINVLCLGGRVVSFDVALDLVRTFLAGQFKGDERYRRRLESIEALESLESRGQG
jgi:ribose 5-phosphate isomerase B